MKFRGWFDVECFNPDGSLAWRGRVENAATNAGLNDVLSAYFAGGTQRTTWAYGLIDGAAFTQALPADTMSSHSGWSEFTSYAESARQPWNTFTVAGQQIVGTTATFTVNANGTVKGFFIASDATKGGTSGLLWATATFAAPQAVQTGQQFRVKYTCQATSNS